jgi:hypothetical protein
MNPNAYVPEEHCGEVATGDRGQRYEVRYFKRETGEECVMGWTERSADVIRKTMAFGA